jgi:hypothetical protein
MRVIRGAIFLTEMYILALSIVSVFILIFCLVLYRKLRYLTRRYQAFMKDGNGASLEGMLQEFHSNIQQVNQEVLSNRNRMKELAQVLDTATRGIGVVRFNAFQDTGSDLSFSVAYLDAHRNGVVISSIYGREESRAYAKPVEGGRSSYQLSQEEQEAIKKASVTLKALSEPVGKQNV